MTFGNETDPWQRLSFSYMMGGSRWKCSLVSTLIQRFLTCPPGVLSVFLCTCCCPCLFLLPCLDSISVVYNVYFIFSILMLMSSVGTEQTWAAWPRLCHQLTMAKIRLFTLYSHKRAKVWCTVKLWILNITATSSAACVCVNVVKTTISAECSCKNVPIATW